MDGIFAACSIEGCNVRATHSSRGSVWDDATQLCDFHARLLSHVHDANCASLLLHAHYCAESTFGKPHTRHLDMGMGAFISGVKKSKALESFLVGHRACDWEPWYYAGLVSLPYGRIGITRGQAIERAAQGLNCPKCLVILDELLENAKT